MTIIQRLQAILSPQIVTVMTLLSMLASYFRIFFGAEVTDEASHVAAALMTSQGAVFYKNDGYFSQTASLPYEPILTVYNWLVGTTGVVLFVRHLYFLLALICFLCFYRLLRKMISPELALMVSSIPVLFIPYSIPILSYNTMGSLCFGIGTALTLNAYLSRRITPALLGGWAFALSVFCYPTLVIGTALVYFGLAIKHWTNEKRIHRGLLAGAVLSGALFFTFWGVTLYRFSYEDILRCIQVTKDYGSATFVGLGGKFDYFFSLIGVISPPGWTLLPVLAGLGILIWKKASWTWSLLLVAAFYLTLVPWPHYSLISHTLITLTFLIGLVSLKTVRLNSQPQLHEVTSLMGLTFLILGVVVFFTSANNIMATPLATQFGLIFVLARTAGHFRKLSLTVPLALIQMLIVLYSYSYTYREEPLLEMNTQIQSGPFAGIFTSDYKAGIFEEIEQDVNKFSKDASSILFYDNFPAGFLFSNLRPATPSLFMHPFPYSKWDRDQLPVYYKDPSNRPDIFFQFEAFPYSRTAIMAYRTELTNQDSFFDFLPNTGDYEVVQERYYYRVWRKKSLPRVQP